MASCDGVLVNEYHLGNLHRSYSLKNENFLVDKTIKRGTTWTLSKLFMNVFLPHGFPDSVSDDYVQYQLWDSIQAFASSITVSLSTHAILKGAGVGDANATTLAATTAWIVKDGTSMLGRIAFSWFAGTKFDCDCKKWRLFADFLNDIALFLDLISAHFVDYYLMILCISGVFKSIVGVAGGATRTAITQHQAKRNNIADVSAKDGSQETLVNLAALICSLIILPVVTTKPLLTWVLYAIMTLVHLFSNYCAVSSVKIQTFNSTRFLIYMKHYSSPYVDSHSSVKEINNKESVFLLPMQDSVSIKLGASFEEAVKSKTIKEIQDLLHLYKSHQYFLSVASRECICICLKPNSTAASQLEAMYQAGLLKNMLTNQSNDLWTKYHTLRYDYSLNSLENFSRQITDEHFSTFLKKLNIMGWKTDETLFHMEPWHITW